MEPIFSDLSYAKSYGKKNYELKEMNTPRKKVQNIKPKNRSVRSKKSMEKIGMSQYYGKIMDNFLGKTKSVRLRKKNKNSFAMDTQDFWLLDDKIKLIDNNIEY